VLVHHWVTAAVAVSVLFGRYSPFATWYGFTVVTMTFPLDFMMAVRAQYSFQYPDFTRKGFVFCFWWFLMALILNVGGQIFIVCNSLLNHYNESIPLHSIVVTAVCICCWFYDDRKLLQSLRHFASMDYEKATVLDRGADEADQKNGILDTKDISTENENGTETKKPLDGTAEVPEQTMNIGASTRGPSKSGLKFLQNADPKTNIQQQLSGESGISFEIAYSGDGGNV